MPHKGNDSRAESKLQIIEAYLTDKYDMRFNTISGMPEYRELGSDKVFKGINENSMYRELEHNGYKCSPNTLKYLLKSDFLKEYNPIADYFKDLPKYDPEKEPDYIFQIGDYITVGNNDAQRFHNQFEKFLVRSIACSLYGFVNKQALVFISSKQNCGKSTFCRWLCPPSLSLYMQENISVDKDSLIALTENFLINMDELATLSKYDLDGLKSFMSKENIKTRKPYDAKALTYQRIANFVGSTNNIEFLTDVTGSVRWLCFEIERINFKYSQDIPIDRLWAQAMHLLSTGFKYQLTPEEVAQNEFSNSRHRIISVEEDLLQRNYTLGSKDNHSAFYSSTEILEALRGSFPLMSKDLHVNRIGKALHALGFIQESKRDEKGSRKGYYVNFNI